jgi:DNA invertase Pin-like site-specific DNA recombinase
MALVGYGRVSTEDQNLEIQIEQLETAGCKRIFREKISGVREDRPELQALLGYVREGDVMVVCKLDRVARSTRHLLEIIDQLAKKDVAFRALNISMDTATPTGKLMLTMLGAIAEFERAMMLERQAEGIARAKAAGKYKGRKPTARERANEILNLADHGVSKASIARQLGIGVASVYRVLRAQEA